VSFCYQPPFVGVGAEVGSENRVMALQ